MMMMMERDQRKSLFTVVLALLVVFLRQSDSATLLASRRHFSAVFIFGDSIVDSGNNNHFVSSAKANFPPYGRDLPGHQASGRFSNARVPGDLVASELGVKELVPPYLSELPPEELLTGVCFASGGTGFDPITPHLVSVLSMPDQIRLFGEYKQRVKAIIGEAKMTNLVANSAYYIVAGTNDIANTYFTGAGLRSLKYDVPSYINDVLVPNVVDFVKKLKQMGAKLIGFVGLPPIGCVPSQRTLAGGLHRQCDPKRNRAAELFNSAVKGVFTQLNREEFKGSGAKAIYLDVFDILIDIINMPTAYGFEDAVDGCCGDLTTDAAVFLYGRICCHDTYRYVFWDSYHPTEKAYRIIIHNATVQYLNAAA